MFGLMLHPHPDQNIIATVPCKKKSYPLYNKTFLIILILEKEGALHQKKFRKFRKSEKKFLFFFLNLLRNWKKYNCLLFFIIHQKTIKSWPKKLINEFQKQIVFEIRANMSRLRVYRIQNRPSHAYPSVHQNIK